MSFKSFIPFEHEVAAGEHIEQSKRKQDYRMDIKFDNIQKVQWYQTIEKDGRVEPVYDGASDEERGQNQEDIETTLMIYLKRPATFFQTKN